jgi:hypothetical protein
MQPCGRLGRATVGQADGLAMLDASAMTLSRGSIRRPAQATCCSSSPKSPTSSRVRRAMRRYLRIGSSSPSVTAVAFRSGGRPRSSSWGSALCMVVVGTREQQTRLWSQPGWLRFGCRMVEGEPTLSRSIERDDCADRSDPHSHCEDRSICSGGPRTPPLLPLAVATLPRARRCVPWHLPPVVHGVMEPRSTDSPKHRSRHLDATDMPQGRTTVRGTRPPFCFRPARADMPALPRRLRPVLLAQDAGHLPRARPSSPHR